MRISTFAIWICTILVVPTVMVVADEKKEAKDKPALSGTWTKKEGQMRIEFTGKDTMKLHPHGDKAEIAVVCKFTIDKEGLVKAKISELEGSAELKEKAKNVIPVGLEFQFQWKTKGGTATIENLDGKDAQGLKSHLEGDYESKV